MARMHLRRTEPVRSHKPIPYRKGAIPFSRVDVYGSFTLMPLKQGHRNLVWTKVSEEGAQLDDGSMDDRDDDMFDQTFELDFHVYPININAQTRVTFR